MNNPELIVMLTHNDKTVKNAYKIFDESKNSSAKFWGLKEKGIPLDEMKKLFSYMKNCGKSTILEVVAYNEEDCVNGAKIAIESECDILMGTVFYDSINKMCQKNNILYMPFVGKVTERPSILNGAVDDMIFEANEYIKKGVFGIDLLSYRYTGDSKKLNERFANEINSPICIAGNVESYQILDEIKKVRPWAFTIGGAFFNNRFGGNFVEQINNVCEYIK